MDLQALEKMSEQHHKNEYLPAEVEASVQTRWAKEQAFSVTEDTSKEKYYCLSMLPYPSGKLHMGHVRNYTISDVLSRYHRLQGKNVLHPMGWDAFGLPAENAAIKHKVPPAKWTYENIDHMRNQLQSLGFMIDWSREFATCRPDYYRWEQLMFTQLFKQGLVYRKSSIVNWDPVEQTVLANEQVVDGRGWRSGAVVEKKELPQWFIKITDYADELLAEIENLDGWPKAVRTMQTNWIGRSEGAEFSLSICDQDANLTKHSFEVYTTRPDTSFGMTYCVLAAEHPLAKEITTDDQRPAVEAFIEKVKNTSEIDRLAETKEKNGVFTGAFALNPFTQKAVPVYLADYVLMTYGTGAIMAVPGQDERDWDFAQQYGIEIIRTVQPPEDFEGGPYTGDGVVINSDWLDGLYMADAKAKAIDWLEAHNIGTRKVNYRLRDWGVSRQRYWGCPIPMILCPNCGDVPVPESDLPVVLPEDVEFMGVQSPIKADPEWRKTTCPTCSGPAERETDTFDTFVESSWYYAHYTSPNADGMIDERANYWLPVDQYIGGIEHAVMHLLYFRFWHKLMRDAGMVNSDEPVKRLLCQGMVLADAYYYTDEAGGQVWVSPLEVESSSQSGWAEKQFHDKEGRTLTHIGMTKMSKSKNNGIDPQTMIDRYGADTMRLYTMFASPPDQTLEWSDHAVEGAFRFLKRLWRAVSEHVDAADQNSSSVLNINELSKEQKDVRRMLHQTIAKVAHDIEDRYAFNTAIAALMELFNAVAKLDDDTNSSHIKAEVFHAMVILLSPIAPHMTQALWERLGNSSLLMDAKWPEIDETALLQDTIEMVVQVNGKLRAKLEVAADSDKQTIEDLALENENVKKFISDLTIRKVIVVPKRLVNIVAN